PYTLAAPSCAATIERTPLPQPTSITVSPGVISSASARVRLVVVGLKTPGPRSSEKGPSRPFQSVSTLWLAIARSGSSGEGPAGQRTWTPHAEATPQGVPAPHPARGPVYRSRPPRRRPRAAPPTQPWRSHGSHPDRPPRAAPLAAAG